MMKKTLLASSIALAVGMASNNVRADDNFYADNEFYSEGTAEIPTVKEGVVFGSAAIVGGIVAGPLGAMVGAIGGAILGKELNKADQYEFASEGLEEKTGELSNINLEMLALKTQLATLQNHKNEIEGLVINELEFQLLFHTGNDTLDEEAMRRLDNLAYFLKLNPKLNVRLHGHADPRGTDGYNNVLSQHRAINVQNALAFYGVERERVERYSYGANKSTAMKGDADAYALERKVTVQIITENVDEFAVVD
ncbi:MAG: outer membrane protein OmpA-like peptidoglycan-associated protein [Cellvibrionaceae bacterium]|jgi:outer membrane protein OmpA-like peptidoglycan-associated protein